MSTKKYRVRLTNGRVVGPLELRDIQDLASRGELTGGEDFQLFPMGDWALAKDYEEISKILNIIDQGDKTEVNATFIKKLDALKELEVVTKRSHDSEDTKAENFPEEFKYEQKNHAESAFTEASNEEKNTKTKEAVISDKKIENEDKTVITTETLKYLEEQKKNEADKKIEEEKLKKLELEKKPEVDLVNDATQVVNLKQVKKKLDKEAKINQKNFEEEEIAAKNKELLQVNNPKNKKALRPIKEAPKKNNRKLIAILVTVLLAAFFLIDDKPVTVEMLAPVDVEIKFPIAFEVPSVEKSQELFLQGIQKLEGNTFLSVVEASKIFRASVENQFNNYNAMAYLIYTYTEILNNSKTRAIDVETIFKLIQVTRARYFNNPYLTAAIANFYYSNKKYAAAAQMIEKYRTDTSKNVTLDMFAVYLDTLRQLGDFSKAKIVYDTISQSETKTLRTVISIIDYLYASDQMDLLKNFLEENESKFGRSNYFLIRKIEFLIKNGSYKETIDIVDKVKKMSCGRSVTLCGQFFQNLGIIAAYFGEVDTVISAYKSIPVTEKASMLTSKLAMLNPTEDERVNVLILESKSIQKIEESKSHLKKREWKQAFNAAIESTSVAPKYIPAKIYLAELQLEHGLYKQAIESLEVLKQSFPNNEDVLYALLQAYTQSYKFGEVKQILRILSTDENRNDARYFAATANYYIYQGEVQNAVIWLQNAIKKDPINDELIYKLARLHLDNNSYRNARFLLAKAIDLDPASVEYKVAYAETIYETDGVDTAIGYLYDLMNDYPKSIEVMGAIGIYYYRSGQIKQFEAIKTKINSLGEESKKLYEFLVQAAKIDDRFDDVVKYSEKILELEPGALNVRLYLGQIYVEKQMYKEALIQFGEIEKRLDNYPRLKYNMSKLYILTDDLDNAAKLAQEEVDANVQRPEGYVLLGEINKKKGSLNEAEKFYKKAQRYAPKDVDVILGLAYINFRKSQFEIALDLYKKAKEIEPDRAEVHKLMGDVYRKIGQSKLAIESYKLFLEISPNSGYKDEIQNYMNLMQ